MAFILDSVCTKITFAFTIPVVASRSAFIILTHSIGCSTLSVSVIPSCSAICFTSRKNISLPVYQYPQDSRSTFRLSADSCRISVYADGYIAGVVALISLWAYSHRPARVSSLTKATDTAKAVSVALAGAEGLDRRCCAPSFRSATEILTNFSTRLALLAENNSPNCFLYAKTLTGSSPFLLHQKQKEPQTATLLVFGRGRRT